MLFVVWASLCMQLYKSGYAWQANRFPDEALASGRKEAVEGFKQNAAECVVHLLPFRQFAAGQNPLTDNRWARYLAIFSSGLIHIWSICGYFTYLVTQMKHVFSCAAVIVPTADHYKVEFGFSVQSVIEYCIPNYAVTCNTSKTFQMLCTSWFTKQHRWMIYQLSQMLKAQYNNTTNTSYTYNSVFVFLCVRSQMSLETSMKHGSPEKKYVKSFSVFMLWIDGESNHY